MKLTQYTKGTESDTEWEISDDNIEGFLHDQMGYHLTDAWEAGDVRSQYFTYREVASGRALAPCIIVHRVGDVGTATRYEYPCEMGKHIRARLTSVTTQTPLKAD